MDSLLLKSGMIQGRNAFLALVCDGVGSMADGSFASGETTRMLSDWFDNAGSAARVGLDMRDAVLRINSYIISRAKESKLDTATTLSAMLFVENSYYITHIGDSRIYCYDADLANDLGSSDRTVSGHIAPNQALSLLTNDDVSISGKLTACVGQTDNIFPHYAEGAVNGKTFILCSDGLYKRMDLDVMISTIRNWDRPSLKSAAEILTRYVIERGEPDNITIAMVKKE